MPTLKATVSANASVGLWQLVQLTEESLDNNFSENNFLPRSALLQIVPGRESKEKLVTAKIANKPDTTGNIFFMRIKNTKSVF